MAADGFYGRLTHVEPWIVYTDRRTAYIDGPRLADRAAAIDSPGSERRRTHYPRFQGISRGAFSA